MRLPASGMFLAGLLDHVFDVERLALAGIEFPNADVDLGAQLREAVDPLQQCTAELLLRRFGQVR
jgi:hypothetical protein